MKLGWHSIVIRQCLGTAGSQGWWTSVTVGAGVKPGNLLQCHVGLGREDIIERVEEEKEVKCEDWDEKEAV